MKWKGARASSVLTMIRRDRHDPGGSRMGTRHRVCNRESEMQLAENRLENPHSYLPKVAAGIILGEGANYL